MKHDDPAPPGYAVHHAAYPLDGLQTQLEKPLADGTCVRHSEIGAELLHSIGVAQVPGQETGREPEKVIPNGRAEITEGPCHEL